MNIEEQIKIVKNMLLHAESQLLDYEATAIETLLTAYEKEKGENVKLRLQDIPLIEGELKAYKDRVKELEQENREIREWKYVIDSPIDLKKLSELDIIKIFGKSYIAKDIIKAKIEELENDPNNIEEHNCLRADTCYVINILQSLLEKEKI